MQLLEQKPIHVRKKIVLSISISLGVILIFIMSILYIGGSQNNSRSSYESSFLSFYATILENAQSFFGGDRAIIEQ